MFTQDDSFPELETFRPPKSPELTDFDFCLWGALKVHAWQTCPAMLEDKTSGKTCRFCTGKATEDVPTLRVDKCVACGSGHITEIVFNTQHSCVLLPNFPSFVSVLYHYAITCAISS